MTYSHVQEGMMKTLKIEHFVLWSLQYLALLTLVCSYVVAQPLLETLETSPTSIDDIVRVTNLFLVNTDTGKDIMPLTDGSSYDLTKLPTSNITIRAVTSDAYGCGWVKFMLDDGVLEHTDLNAPFTLAGNKTDGSLLPSPMLRVVGTHKLKVTPSVDGSMIEVPLEKQELPEQAIRSESFKSCWAIKDFEGIAPPIVTNPSHDKSLSSTSESTMSTATSMTFLKRMFSSLGSGSRPGSENLMEVATTDNALDGSKEISFTVYSGSKPMSSLQARTPTTDVLSVPATIYGSWDTTAQATFEVWHMLTIGFVGPETGEASTSERGPNGPLGPYKDYRVDVTFKHQEGSGLNVVVPGYFALDGDAANSIGKATDGSVWLVHFVPSLPGVWTWSASFQIGENCAPNGTCEESGYFNGKSGSFFVHLPKLETLASMDERDLRRKGKLSYVGKSRLQYAQTKDYLLMAGPASPENFLAYKGFDGTPENIIFLKSYSAHAVDYKSEPRTTWSNGKGKEIIGAINYLASNSMNMFTATTLTVTGPDRNVFPFFDNTSISLYDTSKLEQWRVVFDHASSKGLGLTLQLYDYDSDDYLDGTFEKLYIREMVARFGHHLGMIWCLGDEMTDVAKIKSRADYIRSIDPYNSPIMVQSSASAQGNIYEQLLGYPTIDIITVSGTEVAKATAHWIKLSEEALKPWVVVTKDTSNTQLWPSIMSGGGGIRYIDRDLTLQDFHRMESLFHTAAVAIGIVIPLDTMNIASGTGWMALISSQATVVYKVAGSTSPISLRLTDGSSFLVQWIDPRTGTKSIGTVSTVASGLNVDIGLPMSDLGLDWVAIITCIVPN